MKTVFGEIPVIEQQQKKTVEEQLQEAASIAFSEFIEKITTCEHKEKPHECGSGMLLFIPDYKLVLRVDFTVWPTFDEQSPINEWIM